jgi:hypothetical protein
MDEATEFLSGTQNHHILPPLCRVIHPKPSNDLHRQRLRCTICKCVSEQICDECRDAIRAHMHAATCSTENESHLQDLDATCQSCQTRRHLLLSPLRIRSEHAVCGSPEARHSDDKGTTICKMKKGLACMRLSFARGTRSRESALTISTVSRSDNFPECTRFNSPANRRRVL